MDSAVGARAWHWVAAKLRRLCRPRSPHGAGICAAAAAGEGGHTRCAAAARIDAHEIPYLQGCHLSAALVERAAGPAGRLGRRCRLHSAACACSHDVRCPALHCAALQSTPPNAHPHAPSHAAPRNASCVCRSATVRPGALKRTHCCCSAAPLPSPPSCTRIQQLPSPRARHSVSVRATPCLV